MKFSALTVLAISSFTMYGCGSHQPQPAPAPTTSADPQAAPVEPPPRPKNKTVAPPLPGTVSYPLNDPFRSTYRPFLSYPTVIKHATILTAAGPAIQNGEIVLDNGRVVYVGPISDTVTLPANATIIDGTGKYVTPGIIDNHSHLGVYSAPGVAALSDGNELTNPITPNVWAEHSVWPQDPQFPRILAGGVTTIQVLPGSANLIGGRSVILKVIPSRTVQGMKFRGARQGLKMACGENPKRVYAARGPSTRMGNVAGYRAAFIEAAAYRRKWDKWMNDNQGEPPARDLGMETLADVLRGNIPVHVHCYRADEMAQMLDIAREFGFKIRSFHHAVEAYKIADVLARDSVSASLWADWGSFKMEALDAVRTNIALVHAAGARAIVHSDDPSGAQRLVQEAAKAMAAGRAIGINIPEYEAIKWVTINPAWSIGLDARIGSLETGKNADVVLWSGNPFSIYTRADRVWIDGALMYDRMDPKQQWRTDFELGFVQREAK